MLGIRTPSEQRSASTASGRRIAPVPRLRGQLPLRGALAVDAVGTGLAGLLLLLYLIRLAGLPVGHAGLLLSGAGIACRTGRRRLARHSTWGPHRPDRSSLGAGGRNGWLSGPLLAAAGQRAFWSSVFSVIADVADEGGPTDTDAWFALSGMIQNSGYALGALCASGLLLLPGPLPYQLAVGLNAASFGVSAVLLTLAPRRRALSVPVPNRLSDHPRIWQDRPYLLLIAANTLFAFCSTILGVGIAVYVVDALSAPAWTVGPLLALNTLLGATAQGLAVRATASWPRVRVPARGRRAVGRLGRHHRGPRPRSSRPGATGPARHRRVVLDCRTAARSAFDGHGCGHCSASAARHLPLVVPVLVRDRRHLDPGCLRIHSQSGRTVALAGDVRRGSACVPQRHHRRSAPAPPTWPARYAVIMGASDVTDVQAVSDGVRCGVRRVGSTGGDVSRNRRE